MYQVITLGLACAILKARPSTVIRLGEDVILNGFKNIGHGAQSFAHSVRIEYKARMLNKLQRQIEDEAALVRSLSPEEIEQLVKDQSAILARADELAEQRAAKSSRRASRVGHSAQL